MSGIYAYYESQIIYPEKGLDKSKRIQIINRQLKDLRDALCAGAANFDDLLLSQYAYVITSLNVRNRIWRYSDDSMSFQRRIGELWESFCKAAVRTSIRGKMQKFPDFAEIRPKLKNIPDELLDLLGNINMKTDGILSLNKKIHVFDLKYSFQSHEKGNMQRLKTVGKIYKLWKPSVNLHVLVRDQDCSDNYLQQLGDTWEIKRGKDVYKEIKNLTGHDLQRWIKTGVNFKKHLDRDLYDYVTKNNLEKYLQW